MNQNGGTGNCIGRMLVLILLAAAGLAGCGGEGGPGGNYHPILDPPDSRPVPVTSNLPSLAAALAGLPRADVAGRVVTDDGRPVAGAAVYLCYQHGDPYGARDRLAGQTTSGPDGSFRLERALVWEPATDPDPDQGAFRRELVEARYAVLAHHAAGGIGAVVLLEGDSAGALELRLHRTPWAGARAVRVRDEAGQPLAGARVWPMFFDLSDAKDSRHCSFLMRRAIGLGDGVTTASGECPKVDVRFFYTTCLVEKEGLGSVKTDGLQPCVLWPAAQVEGRVTAPDGSPAAEVEVRAVVEYKDPGTPFRTGMLTDAQGHYRFSGLPVRTAATGELATGQVTLWVADPRPQTRLMPLMKSLGRVRPGERLTRDLQLAESCRVAGRVVDAATSQPLAGVRLAFRTDYRPYISLSTDRDGRFHTVGTRGAWADLIVEDSREGEYLLDPTPQAPGKPALNWQAYSLNRDMTDLVFKVRLIPLRSLGGRVVDAEGVGVPGMNIGVHKSLPQRWTDRWGDFTIKVPATDAPVELLAWKYAFGRLEAMGMTSVTRNVGEVTIRVGESTPVQGVVIDQEQRPVPALTFRIQPSLNGSALEYLTLATVESDALGRFQLPALPPQLTVQAFWDNYTTDKPGSANRLCDEGKQVIDLRRLRPGEPVRLQVRAFRCAMSGRVLDPQGRPVAGAQLRIDKAPRPRQLAGNDFLKSGPAGEFHMGGLDRGQVSCTIYARGFYDNQATLATDRPDQVIVMKPLPTGTLTYRAAVRDAAGRPVAGAKINLQVQDWSKPAVGGRSASLFPPCSAVTDAAGAAVLRWILPEGGYRRQFPGILACDVPGCDLYYRRVDLYRDFELAITLRAQGEPIPVRVVDEIGHPVGGARARLEYMCPEGLNDRESLAFFEGPSVHEWVADAQGGFTLPRLDARDRLGLKVRAPGMATLQAGVKKTSSTVPVELKMQVAGTLRGRVTVAGGGAFPGAGVFFVWLRPGAGGGDVPVGADGTYEANDLEQNAYEIFLSQRYPVPGGDPHFYTDQDPGERRVQVRSGQVSEKNLEALPCLPVAGTLTLTGRDGRPVERPTGVFINFIRGDVVRLSAGVTAEGRWLAWLPVGEYDLSANVESNDPDGIPMRQPLTLAPGRFTMAQTLTTATLALEAKLR